MKVNKAQKLAIALHRVSLRFNSFLIRKLILNSQEEESTGQNIRNYDSDIHALDVIFSVLSIATQKRKIQTFLCLKYFAFPRFQRKKYQRSHSSLNKKIRRKLSLGEQTNQTRRALSSAKEKQGKSSREKYLFQNIKYNNSPSSRKSLQNINIQSPEQTYIQTKLFNLKGNKALKKNIQTELDVLNIDMILKKLQDVKSIYTHKKNKRDRRNCVQEIQMKIN